MKTSALVWLLGSGPGDGLASDSLASSGASLALEPTGLGLGWLVVFMVGFLTVAALLQRRFGLAARYRGQPELRMIANLPLGEKRAIVMVEAATERLLVGITPQSVQLISRLAPTSETPLVHEEATADNLDEQFPSGLDEAANAAKTPVAKGRFVSFLRSALERGRR